MFQKKDIQQERRCLRGTKEEALEQLPGKVGTYRNGDGHTCQKPIETTTKLSWLQAYLPETK